MNKNIRHKPVTLSIREDVLNAARALNLNMSEAAEIGIRQSLRQSQSRQWLLDNKEAIDAYNRDTERNRSPIPPIWTQE